jgi:hypothetical protein
MSNWEIPRAEAIRIVVDLRRRGYDVNDVARHVAQTHYLGASVERAAALLARDAIEAFWVEHGGRTHEQERIQEMAEALRVEGWVLVNHPGFGYLWRHRVAQVDVNRGGGTFDTFEAATVATYESATRQVIQGVEV